MGNPAMIWFHHEVPEDACVSLLDWYKQCFEAFDSKLSVPISRAVSTTQLGHHVERKLQTRCLATSSIDRKSIGNANIPKQLAPTRSKDSFQCVLIVGMRGHESDFEEDRSIRIERSRTQIRLARV